ncbi:4-phosphopantetheinyl transferase [Halomonas urmiana]|uniref:4-phosphopantetheinyl transferase n=1 Tax=Halomonas urmiana TaxID=490901 RepID=A0A5R8MII9_9GAMM|nr:4-phosphopantetheinyl transferase [Halomonas urmiana]TLF51781.1 4-phosphopantetheinyl transferase [Halomonas urmiana]
MSELAAERGLDCPVSGWSPRGTGPPRHPGLPDGLHAGLSHRHGRVVAALADCPFGLDLEHALPRHRRHLAERADLLPEPWVRRRILAAETPLAAFYRAWTLHEALFKFETLRGRPPTALLATRLGTLREPHGPAAWRWQQGDWTLSLCAETPTLRIIAPASLTPMPLTTDILA